MNDEKLKSAFSNIRFDIEQIKNQIDNIKKIATLNEDIKLQIKTLQKFDLEKFVVNLENEFKSINSLLQQFNTRFNTNVSEFEKFSTKMQKYYNELQFVKQNLQEVHEKQNVMHNLNPQEIEKQLNEVKSNIAKDLSKVLLEVAKLKEEQTLHCEKEKQELTSSIKEFGEVIGEKIDFELSQVKQEQTEEISRVYDRLFGEVAKLKEEIRVLKRDKLVDIETPAQKTSLGKRIITKPMRKLKSVADKWFSISDTGKIDEEIKEEIAAKKQKQKKETGKN